MRRSKINARAKASYLQRKKRTPSFVALSRKDNEQLYIREELVHQAMEELIIYRMMAMDEQRGSCAVPEAIFSILDLYDDGEILPALLHWLRRAVEQDNGWAKTGLRKLTEGMQ